MVLFEIPVKDLTFDQLQLLKVRLISDSFAVIDQLNAIISMLILMSVNVFVFLSSPIQLPWKFMTTKVEFGLIYVTIQMQIIM